MPERNMQKEYAQTGRSPVLSFLSRNLVFSEANEHSATTVYKFYGTILFLFFIFITSFHSYLFFISEKCAVIYYNPLCDLRNKSTLRLFFPHINLLYRIIFSYESYAHSLVEEYLKMTKVSR